MKNPITEKYVQTVIARDKKSDTYTFIGPRRQYQPVVNYLWNQWVRFRSVEPGNGQVVNMNTKDPFCVDRRFLTTDPDNWIHPSERKPGASSDAGQ